MPAPGDPHFNSESRKRNDHETSRAPTTTITVQKFPRFFESPRRFYLIYLFPECSFPCAFFPSRHKISPRVWSDFCHFFSTKKYRFFIRVFVPHLFFRSFLLLFILSSFVCSFIIRLFVHSFLHFSIPSFIHSLIDPFIHSFIVIEFGGKLSACNSYSIEQ